MENMQNPATKKEKVCLVIQGGSLRGAHTCGFLKVCADENIHFDTVMGISAGALHGVSFIGKQLDRAITVQTRHIKKQEFLSAENLLSSGQLMNINFLFQAIKPNKKGLHGVSAFDWTPFDNSPIDFVCGVTDAETGLPVYFRKGDLPNMQEAVVASASLPIVTNGYKIGEKLYYDGGIADPIMLHKAQEEGYGRIVILMTREYGFRSRALPEARRAMYQLRYRDYPNFLKALKDQSLIYNQLYNEIEELELAQDPSVFVIRPKTSIAVTFQERSKKLMKALVKQGMDEAKQIMPKLKEFLA